MKIVSCGCPINRWCNVGGQGVEVRSVTFVGNKGVNLVGGEVCLLVPTANCGQGVVVGVGGLVKLGLADGCS